MLASGPASGDGFAGALDDGGSVVVMPGTGVPERGEPDASETLGAVGRPRGSAECCRLSC
jgi:hypothetical protein